MKDSVTTLQKAPVGSECIICDVDSTLPIKGRLNELGFCKGNVVGKIQTGFGGSPIAFRVCGAVIALRADDADKIFACVHQ